MSITDEPTVMPVEISDLEALTSGQWSAPDDGFEDHCRVCGKGLVYGGRGRRPVACDEHKKGTPTSRAAGSTTNLKSLERSLTEFYMMLGAGVAFLGPDFTPDAQDIMSNADTLAHSWIVLAETNPKVKRFLQKMTTGGGTGAVVIAHAMVAFPIMSRHGLNPFAPKSGDDE